MEADSLQAGMQLKSLGPSSAIRSLHRELEKDNDLVTITLSGDGWKAQATVTQTHFVPAQAAGETSLAALQPLQALELRPHEHVIVLADEVGTCMHAAEIHRHVCTFCQCAACDCDRHNVD